MLVITTTHLFTSSQVSFSKRIFLRGVWVAEGRIPGPLGICPPLWPPLTFPAPPELSTPPCVPLPLASVSPSSCQGESDQSGLQVEKIRQKSGVMCCVATHGLPALSGPRFPFCKIREGLDPHGEPFECCGVREAWCTSFKQCDLGTVTYPLLASFPGAGTGWEQLPPHRVVRSCL